MGEPQKWLEDEKNHNDAYEKQAEGRTTVSKEMLPLRLREGQLYPLTVGFMIVLMKFGKIEWGPIGCDSWDMEEISNGTHSLGYEAFLFILQEFW